MAVITQHRLPGLVLKDHLFDLPLRHAKPNDRRIEVFAREAVALEHEHAELPWLVFFQGGPGSGSPRPMGRTGWLGAALKKFRVLLLDQRGTARSSRIDATSLAIEGTPEAQADYLACFRADAIVEDAEAIRRELCGDLPWTILGQSFGGFCALNYLSFHPAGLKGVIITGGIPPIGVAIDDIYRATYQRVIDRNAEFYRRYPGDAQRVREVVDYLQANKVYLPGGAHLTPAVLQLLGLDFGFSDGFETVHYLLEEAFITGPEGPNLSHNFLHGIDMRLPFETSPLFSLLHEALYCEGTASGWSADRVRQEFPMFDAGNAEQQPVLFTGEMIYPWMFEVFPRLAPLAAAADLLANRTEWPALYCEHALATNKVPTVAAVYANDMFVERRFSEAVVARVPNIRMWLTSEYEHNGLRADGEGRVFSRLLDMLEGQA